MPLHNIACLCVVLVVCLGVFGEGGADTVGEIAATIEQNAPRLGGNTVAVFPFPYADGIKSIEGSLLSERIMTALTDGGVVRVVERALLDKILEEQKLSASGLADPTSAVQVGKLLGARGILSGTVTDLGENIEVHARLLSVETGEIVASIKQTMPKTIKTFISPLWSEIDRIKKENASFGVNVWVDKGQGASQIPSYRIGDFLTLHFKADRDCYVTIFDFTSSGSINVLFPNAFVRDNKVKAGREYVLPDPQAGFKIRVKDPPGIERIKLFATTKDIPLFQEDYSQEKFRSVTDTNYSVSRDLQAVMDSLEDNAWAEAQLEVRIEQILRGDTKP